MKLILDMYARFRFYNTTHKLWFSLLAPVTQTAEGWGMAVTLTVIVETYYVVERCCDESWWTFSGISVRDCSVSIHTAYRIQRYLRGAGAFWKHAECSNKSTHSLDSSGGLTTDSSVNRSGTQKHISAARTLRAKAFFNQKKCICELKCNTCHLPVKTFLHV